MFAKFEKKILGAYWGGTRPLPEPHPFDCPHSPSPLNISISSPIPWGLDETLNTVLAIPT